MASIISGFLCLFFAKISAEHVNILRANRDGNIPPTSSTSGEITFYVNNPFKIVETENYTIAWSSSTKGVKRVQVYVEDEMISVITDHKEVFHDAFSNATEYYFKNESTSEAVAVQGSIDMTARFIGFNKVVVVLRGDHEQILGNGTLRIDVLLLAKELTKIYQVCLSIVLIIVYTNMGANLDLNLVKDIVKQPIGPAIGLFCQYCCMPLIAFGLGLLIFPNEPLFRLGLFASGSSPGGGLSNMWTHVLGGSLDLSIMMTFCSTVAALGAVPMWLLTLGKVIVEEADFVIPFKNVLIGIAILILPCFVGIFIQIKFPRVAGWMKKLLTPLSLFNICFIFSFGVYTNLYLFSYLTWKAVGAGCGQTLLGHFAGFIIAFMFRRSTKEMIAISIETAVQNNGIAFLLLKMSLEKPAGDLAVLIPGCVALFMSMPLLIALILKLTYQRLFSSKTDSPDQDATTVDGEPDENGELKERQRRVTDQKEAKKGNGKSKKSEQIMEKRFDRIRETGIDNPASDSMENT